eukprot:Gb_38354 [translate_table: standard]
MGDSNVLDISSDESDSTSDQASECSEYNPDGDADAVVISDSDDSEDESELRDREADHDSVEEEPEVTVTEEARYDKVMKLIARGSDLKGLRLEECKAYLRKHGLRLTGTKSICIQRIHEHLKIKDGGGQKIYPRASFVINCRGDVCTGDVVLFTQKVYEKFDIASRGGAQTPLGKRTIAGRVVKESYGAAKQQHTFTVEILWSTGVKALPPLYPLLIKGRNLYRLRTCRQRWPNEAERAKVLAEKHARGDEARNIRAAAKAWHGSKDRTCSQNRNGSEPPWKRQKVEKLDSRKTVQKPHITKSKSCKSQQSWKEKSGKKGSGHPSPTSPLAGHMRHKIEVSKATMPVTSSSQMCNSGTGDAIPRFGHEYNQYHEDVMHNQHMVRLSRTQPIHQHLVNAEAWHPSNLHPAVNYQYGSTIRRPSVDPCINTRQVWMPLNPVPNGHLLPSIHGNPRPEWTSRPGAFLPPQGHLDRSHLAIQQHIHAVPNVQAPSRKLGGSLACSSAGCHDLGARDCINSACSQCCRRVGRKCKRHKVS